MLNLIRSYFRISDNYINKIILNEGKNYRGMYLSILLFVLINFIMFKLDLYKI